MCEYKASLGTGKVQLKKDENSRLQTGGASLHSTFPLTLLQNMTTAWEGGSSTYPDAHSNWMNIPETSLERIALGTAPGSTQVAPEKIKHEN